MTLPLVVDAFEQVSAFSRLADALPPAGASVGVDGLAGSADAVLVAALSHRLGERRFFMVVAETLPDAERWLADLDVLVGGEGSALALYPPREGFGEVEPHLEVAGERVETLEHLARGRVRMLVTTARAAMERTQLPRTLNALRLELRRGDEWRPEALAAHLDAIGFERVPLVDDVAQYSVRGGIFDIYSFGMAHPVRLEFWGDEIVAMRHFDIATQRSTRDAEMALVLPVDGYAPPPEDHAPAHGGAAPGAVRGTVADLVPPDAIVLVPDRSRLQAELDRTWEEARHHVELARRRGEDAPPREELYLAPADTLARLGAFGTIVLHPVAMTPGRRRAFDSLPFDSATDGAAGADTAADDPATTPRHARDGTASASATAATAELTFPIRPPDRIDRDLKQLRRVLRDGVPTVILCDNAGQCERLEELLSEDGGAAGAALTVGVLTGGFVIPPGASATRGVGANGAGGGLRIFTDHEIFRRDRRIRRHRKYDSGVPVEAAGTLQPGDYVVHLEHGVGLYRGIEQIFVRESLIEVAVVEYEGGDRLNVPLYRIDQLERYRAGARDGDEAPPPRLHKLGGRRWTQQRDKTKRAILEMTQELLDLYARRRMATKPPAIPDTSWQRQLESSFLFEDTPDQRLAADEVKRDMESPRPMDRLLVGDVGYGKTEIAVRAAFKAVQSGRQVAVLVPTTILAEQHGRTFGDRMADFPIRVVTLSRFQNAREQSAVLAEIAAKKADIVIGTHRLLSKDVQFGDLGLLIIDEEHRFGVRHKERLKQLRLETDVLTLTATPIPRTLHLSLAGLRDMTLIRTPPRDRSPVLTFVEPWDDALIEEGIARELDRGGQVFFVHNRIETIDAVAAHVRRLAPRAEVAVAHGQMRERDLEDVMHRFVDGAVQVLVSTMIVESGLDVPNANTMFVNRADHFGLAQLYQLRGRVGRSHRRAYCYLLVPEGVDADAERRLEVLEHHTELGSGYRVALRDLEMRGAGNLLGAEQSGFVYAVGFELYLRMLDETVQRLLRGEEGPRLLPADVSMDLPTYIPDDYIAIPAVKLDVYRRLASLADPAEIDALRDELRDRFGPLPTPAEHFLAAALLRVLGGRLGVEGILVRGDDARVTFRADAVPRLKGLTAAFHEVQFEAEVRRTHPLSLKLTRLGGATLLDGLLRALRTLR